MTDDGRLKPSAWYIEQIRQEEARRAALYGRLEDAWHSFQRGLLTCDEYAATVQRICA